MAITVENLKGFVTFLREGIIVVVLLLFLVLPGVMNSVMRRAGFTRADIAGLEWELGEIAQNTNAAIGNVAELEIRLDAFNKQLDRISQAPTVSPQVKQEITSLSKDVAQARSDTRIVQSRLQDSLESQRVIIGGVNPRILQRLEAQKPKR